MLREGQSFVATLEHFDHLMAMPLLSILGARLDDMIPGQIALASTHLAQPLPVFLQVVPLRGVGFGKNLRCFASSRPLHRTGSVTRSWTPHSNNSTASANRWWPFNNLLSLKSDVASLASYLTTGETPTTDDRNDLLSKGGRLNVLATEASHEIEKLHQLAIQRCQMPIASTIQTETPISDACK
jgi:hypothetical protein